MKEAGKEGGKADVSPEAVIVLATPALQAAPDPAAQLAIPGLGSAISVWILIDPRSVQPPFFPSDSVHT